MRNRVHRRIITLAVRPHLPQRTIKLRLTVIYGVLFLVCGAALLGITYALVEHATAGTYSYTDSNGLTVTGRLGGSSGAQGSPPQSTPELKINGGATETLTPQQAQALERELQALAADQHAHVMRELLLYSGIALATMAVVSIVLGWLVAGRVLRPLRTITNAANDISATNLHQRLALAGPDDELKKLGDTFDNLLGRLEGAFTAQRHFVANASHELRTPLTLIRALLQMTLTDPDATIDTFRSTCHEVMAVGEHQERLIEALLVLARSERGLDLRERLDLSDVSEQILRELRPRAAYQELHVTTSLHAASVDGDTRLVERLVANLIDNAVRHNIVGGRVEVVTGSREGRSVVSVANTGPVIPPDDVQRLLQPFQRLGPDSAQPGGDGLGLGLSIVQAIATAHDADLTARPHPGGGLIMEVSFPKSSVHLRNTGTATNLSPSGQTATTATR